MRRMATRQRRVRPRRTRPDFPGDRREAAALDHADERRIASSRSIEDSDISHRDWMVFRMPERRSSQAWIPVPPDEAGVFWR